MDSEMIVGKIVLHVLINKKKKKPENNVYRAMGDFTKQATFKPEIAAQNWQLPTTPIVSCKSNNEVKFPHGVFLGESSEIKFTRAP